MVLMLDLVDMMTFVQLFKHIFLILLHNFALHNWLPSALIALVHLKFQKEDLELKIILSL
jgi:hypothetical protein